MSLIRHFLAMLVIVGFGYLYVEHKKINSGELADAYSSEFDPFSEWGDAGEAPAFGADSSTSSASSFTDVPTPIPFPEESTYGLPADAVSLTEQGTQQPPNPSPFDQRAETKRSQDSGSLWDEPVSSSRNSFSPPENPGNENPLAPLADNSFGQTEYQDPKAPKPSAATVSFWRQFSIGQGEEPTVAVLDESVARSPQTLSALFAGLRREWIASPENNPSDSLLLFIANPEAGSAKEAQQELTEKLQNLEPTRIVRISQGTADQGAMQFTSAEESMNALLNLPGSFRIKEQGTRPAIDHSLDVPTVLVELPRDGQSDPVSSMDLLADAINGTWAQTVSEPTKPSTSFNPFGSSTAGTTKKSEEIIPEEIQETITESVTEFLPPPRRSIEPVEEPKSNAANDLLSSIFGYKKKPEQLPPPPQEIQPQISEPETDRPTASDLKDIAADDLMQERVVIRKVEILQPPPSFKSQVSLLEEPEESRVFALPPPPKAK